MDLYMIQQRKHTRWHVTPWVPLVTFPVTAVCGAQVTPEDTHTGMKPYMGRRPGCPVCRRTLYLATICFETSEYKKLEDEIKAAATTVRTLDNTGEVDTSYARAVPLDEV